MNIIEAMKILNAGGTIQKGTDPRTQRFKKKHDKIALYEWQDSYEGYTYFKADGDYTFSAEDIQRTDWIEIKN